MVRIRSAVASDAEAMCQVHFEAVRETAAAFYPRAVIEGWSSPPGEGGYERFRRAVSSKDELFLAAELDEAVIAFGSIVASARELRSLYVHPRFGRQGLGAAILRQLEQLATAAGIPSLHLTASLNAEQFYAHHGYEVLGRGTHRSSTGMEMACVNMKKDL